jgi:hypothetical protein
MPRWIVAELWSVHHATGYKTGSERISRIDFLCDLRPSAVSA